MAKDLSIEIQAKLTVSDETAATCVTLLNMYLKENKPQLIITENNQTGEAQIEIKDNKITRQGII